MDFEARPAWRSRAWVSVLVVLVGVWVLLAAVGVDGTESILSGLLAITAITTAGIVFLFWLGRRRRRAFEEKLTAWAAERAASEERLRIARELHDLASHGIGLITIRAAAARGVTGSAGERERERALAEIEDSGRRAMAELRRMLTVLRGGEGDSEAAPRRPMTSLADLPGIIADAECSGIRVRLGSVEPGGAAAAEGIPAGIQAAACAIVGEGLANIARHAGPVAAVLRVEPRSRDLLIELTDTGPRQGWTPLPGAGHGLIGVRERAAAFGGELRAGPFGNGFRLMAVLPFESRGVAMRETTEGR